MSPATSDDEEAHSLLQQEQKRGPKNHHAIENGISKTKNLWRRKEKDIIFDNCKVFLPVIWYYVQVQKKVFLTFPYGAQLSFTIWTIEEVEFLRSQSDSDANSKKAVSLKNIFIIS